MDNIVNLKDLPFQPSCVSSIDINASVAAMKSLEETKLCNDKDKEQGLLGSELFRSTSVSKGDKPVGRICMSKMGLKVSKQIL